MSRKLIVILVCLVFIILCVNVFVLTKGKEISTYIDDNTFVEETLITGTKIEELEKKITEISDKKLETIVIFKNGDIEKQYTYKDLNTKTNQDSVITEIKKYYSTNLLTRLQKHYFEKDLEKKYVLELIFDNEKIREVIKNDFSNIETTGNIEYSLQDTSLEVKVTKSKVIDYANVLEELRNKSLDVYVITTDINPEINKEEVIAYLNKNSSKVNQKPKDASIAFIGEEISVVDGYNGKTLNEEKSVKNISSYIAKGERLIPLAFDETEPKVKAETLRAQLKDIKVKIGSCTTSFTSSATGRATNVQIAAAAFNGIVLAPGETLSFNNTVGNITRAKGYQTATVFSGGKAVDGLGGGVCQVATTLYDAALYANLEIVERHNHGLPVGYVKPSHDATVASSSGLDFKFKNNTNGYIYIKTDTTNRKLTVDIYGVEKKYDVELTSTVLNYIEPTEKRILDTTLAPGTEKVIEKGSRGYKSEAYKIVKQNGAVISKEKLSTDTYRATVREVHYNDAIAPQEVPIEMPQ